MSEWISTPESSHVDAIRYEEDTQDCFVRFNDSSIYQYMDVPERTWSEFLDHPSKGRYVNVVLKNQFKYRRVS